MHKDYTKSVGSIDVTEVNDDGNAIRIVATFPDDPRGLTRAETLVTAVPGKLIAEHVIRTPYVID